MSENFAYVNWTCDICGTRCRDISCLCGRSLIDFRIELLRKEND